ncbi:group II intron maturase-specific domain-containing protein [Halothece sp. PCC 7418]|nr:group II intron maturase-specific domain-containing protein [Halothece sp. PCC 7418]
MLRQRYSHYKKIGETLKLKKSATQEEVIKTLHPLLGGFANYF